MQGGFKSLSLPGGLRIDELRFALDSRGTGSLEAENFRLGGSGAHSCTGVDGASEAAPEIGRLVVDAACPYSNYILLAGAEAGAWLAGVRELEVCYAGEV